MRLAIAGRAPSQHVQREPQGGEVPAARAVPDLGDPGDLAFQDLDGGAVLLEMLGREIRKVDLDRGDESGKSLNDLLGGPKRPFDHKLVHVKSLQLSFKIWNFTAAPRRRKGLAAQGRGLLPPAPPRALPTDLDRVGPPGGG